MKQRVIVLDGGMCKSGMFIEYRKAAGDEIKTTLVKAEDLPEFWETLEVIGGTHYADIEIAEDGDASGPSSPSGA